MDYATIFSRIEGLKPDAAKPNQFSARCPCKQNHKNGDKHPSLRVKVCEDRLICWCGKGCKFEEIAEALGTQPGEWFLEYKPNKKRLKTMPDNFEAIYDYQNESGELLYQVCRKKYPDGGRTFIQRRPMPGFPDEWAYSLASGYYVRHTNGFWGVYSGPQDGAMALGPVRAVIYRLPRFTEQPDWPVIVVEGEKDVHSLEAVFAGQKMLITTNSGGAGRWQRKFGGHLAGRRVAIIPDNDEPGLEHAAAVAASAILYGAKAVRIVRWPKEIAEGADISDWLGRLPQGCEKRTMALELIHNNATAYEVAGRSA